MLKILSVVMVQFLLVGLQVYAQSGKPGRDARGNDPAGLTSNVTAAQAESRIIQPSLHQHLDVDVDVVSGPKKDDWDRISLGINFFLALVGAAGVVSAVITLLIIRKQVDEMRGQSATMSTTLATIKNQAAEMAKQTIVSGDAAAAALLNAQTVINAERARIIDLIKLSVGLRIEIVAWNCGRSPAKLIYAFIGKVILEREDKLPAIPAYEGGEFQDSWVAPGGNEQHRVVLEDDYRECFSNNNAGVLPEFKDGSKQFWLYGLLRYYDPVSATEYDYRFCYRAFFSKIGVRFSGDGPDAYRGEIKL